MIDVVERLNGFANWHISCSCGNVSDEAQTCIDAVERIQNLQNAIEAIIYTYAMNNGDSHDVFKAALEQRVMMAKDILNAGYSPGLRT